MIRLKNTLKTKKSLPESSNRHQQNQNQNLPKDSTYFENILQA